MVQRKALSKPTFKASPSLEAIKKPSTNMKSSIQSLDSKARGPELAKKMKKSRSFKRPSDPSSRRHHLSPPPCSPVKESQSPPNYMKSTSSSEARKEQKQTPTKTPIKSVIETTPKRLFSSSSSSSSSPRLVSRTSSLEKVRTLTKAPSFKPSRSTIISVKKCSKTALCDVKRATCSSTMKDTKFPSYLDLTPGGTEYEGASVMKVCPYNYCSLNGHRHSPAPPLKSFLCARRRVMKAQRSLKPVASSPSKAKPCLEDDQDKEEADFFVQVYVKEGDDKAETAMEAAQSECVYDAGSFDWESSTSITLDELFAEGSDMEWDEENRICLTGMELEDDVSIRSECESDHTQGNEFVFLLDEEGLKKDDVNVEFLKELLEQEEEEISQDEIIDFHEQSSDSESSSMNDAYEETELDQFFQVPFAADEETKTDEDMEESGFAKQALQNAEQVQDESDLKADLLPVERKNQEAQATEQEDETTSDPEEDQSKEDSKPSGSVVSKARLKKECRGGEVSSPCSSSLIITKGKRRDRGEESEEIKSFNPREPNYLEVEPDPEAEKVDLKHQEMDERRNSEEWMLDYALRKAVNELAPARKKKVALLVAAFETVAPPPRSCETHPRRISSDFARIQACN